MLKVAFKEWAVICAALAQGKQSLILRKGGIAETENTFYPNHPRFWLFPTYTHQQAMGIKAEALPLLQQTEADRPPSGTIRLSHFAEMAGIYHVHDLVPVLLLSHLYLWSEETVRARFAYRQPGLYVLQVRVYRAATAVELPENPYFAGCKSWVELEPGFTTDPATPVVRDADFQHLSQTLNKVLNPVALA